MEKYWSPQKAKIPAPSVTAGNHMQCHVKTVTSLARGVLEENVPVLFIYLEPVVEVLCFC